MSANELIERLRARKVCKDGIRRQPQKHEREAADLLASQAAEIERLREALIWADLKIRSLPHTDQSDVEPIRQALKGTGAEHG